MSNYYMIITNKLDYLKDVENEFHNPDKPIYVVFNGATDALLREPEDYPWAAISVQNGVPQLSEVHVTENSLTITTHDADSWATVDSFTIYKDKKRAQNLFSLSGLRV